MTDIAQQIPDREVLRYEAPYLTKKLLEEGVADHAADAEALFNEVKRYLLLTQRHSDVGFDMYSHRIDAAWHSFILFTEEYARFCQRFFGAFLHHVPSNAPGNHHTPSQTTADFRHFGSMYEAMFGERVPDLWYDHKSMALDRRLVRVAPGTLTVGAGDDRAILFASNGGCLLTVNGVGIEALRFVASMRRFYVRELPGGLSDDEKLCISEVLVERKILRVG